MIHILFTGGTISMQRDAAAGGNVPAHGGEALLRKAAQGVADHLVFFAQDHGVSCVFLCG